MGFPAHTRSILLLTASLVNSRLDVRGGERDPLATPRDFLRILSDHGYSGRSLPSPGDVAVARLLRLELAELWNADLPDAAAGVNALLQNNHAILQIAPDGAQGWRFLASSSIQPLVNRIATDIAISLSEVIQAGEFGRLRVCAVQDCGKVYVDWSRNRSRRYCDPSTCGNRTNVLAYRARRKR